MSRNNDADIDPLPDEPPPPYEPLPGETTSSMTTTAAPTTTAPVATASTTTAPGANTNTASHNPFLAPEERPSGASTTTTAAPAASPNPTSHTNPFLSSVTPQHSGASTTLNTHTTAATISATPPLPPRPAAAHSPTTSIAEPTGPSLDSRHSRHSSTITSPVSPVPPTPSAFAPPPRPPPTASSSSTSSRPPARPNDSYRPTTVPAPGHPLLRKGKLLVYPRNWTGCPKCNDTGYKHGDPNNPHKSCWDKYGKNYTSAMSYSTGLNNTGTLQKPLPLLNGPNAQGMNPWSGGLSHGHMPGGYPGAGGGGFGPPRSPPGPMPSPYGGGGYASPMHAPPLHVPPPPQRPPPSPAGLDAETEGARMSDVPPNYQDASNVAEHERLPSQYVPPAQPPPGHGPQSPPLHSPPPHPPQGGYHYGPPPVAAGPPRGFVGGFGRDPGGPNPYVTFQPPASGWYGARPPPPGALVVMPGDPRIGGRLCNECGGRGLTESFWFGDETCLRCRGSGRIF
ncbi:hypothetical protein NDA12_004908 [Ustilago hordei]|nr:hypothetical protein NDA15_005664 [Ustilago hordei]KAJ1578700.1 hypothetical protein NDA12_004908 [Ustilago hordei]